ncbi:MAG: hypothetical protein NZM11_00740 [Anaerolineales bacterium]|nr:hypothetical protein [Anaerolineales bacterium]
MGHPPILFEVLDPKGRKVICHRVQWQEHVVANRPFMDSDYWVELARDAVEAPDYGIVYQDADYPNRNCYYAQIRGTKRRQYIKVVVEFDDTGRRGHVVTAMRTDYMKPGEKPL